MFDKLLHSEKERCCLQSSMREMLWLKKPSFTRVIQRKVDFCFKQKTLLTKQNVLLDICKYIFCTKRIIQQIIF